MLVLQGHVEVLFVYQSSLRQRKAQLSNLRLWLWFLLILDYDGDCVGYLVQTGFKNATIIFKAPCWEMTTQSRHNLGNGHSVLVLTTGFRRSFENSLRPLKTALCSEQVHHRSEGRRQPVYKAAKTEVLKLNEVHLKQISNGHLLVPMNLSSSPSCNFSLHTMCFLTVSSTPCLETGPHKILQTPLIGHC